MRNLIYSLMIGFSLYPLTTMAQEDTDEAGCISSACHTNLLSHEVVHAPTEDGCETCHESNAENHPDANGREFSLTEILPDLCYMCHDANAEQVVVHAPVEEGECTICHSPHSSSQPFLLISDEEDNFCGTCHDLESDGNTVQHGPVISNSCTSCHEAHQSNTTALLKKTAPELCFDCHDQIQEQFQEFSNLHAPVEDDCFGCHLPHNAPAAFLLFDEDPQLCYNCHDGVESDLAQKSFVHTPLKNEVKCLECHSPHGSQHAALLVAEQPQVCYDCHSKTKKTNDEFKTKKESIQSKLSNKKNVHSPAADGECGSCHNPHASDTYSQLSLPFPEKNYADGRVESFALCFECHDSDLLEKPASTSATNFRNGEQNLHYLHINKEKGRSCKTCHDLHASDNQFLIANKVLFGKWEMPINFHRNDSGGSCLPGCHEKQIYER